MGGVGIIICDDQTPMTAGKQVTAQRYTETKGSSHHDKASFDVFTTGFVSIKL